MKKILILMLFLIVSSLGFSYKLTENDYCIGISNYRYVGSPVVAIYAVSAKLCRINNKVYRNKNIAHSYVGAIILPNGSDDPKGVDFRKKMILTFESGSEDGGGEMSFEDNNTIFMGSAIEGKVYYLEDDGYLNFVKKEDLKAVYGN